MKEFPMASQADSVFIVNCTGVEPANSVTCAHIPNPKLHSTTNDITVTAVTKIQL